MRNTVRAVASTPIVQRVAIKMVVTLAEWLVAKTENKFDDKLLAAIKEAAGLK